MPFSAKRRRRRRRRNGFTGKAGKDFRVTHFNLSFAFVWLFSV
jgi:hypothetical protein